MPTQPITHLDRFLSVMEYQPVDRVPNWELGVWPQTRERWESDGLDSTSYHWDWFTGEATLGMDPREFIRFNCFLIPAFDEETLEETERYVTLRDSMGRTRKALKEGTVRGGRMSMDTYIDFPVHNMEEWQALKSRLLMRQERYEPYWWEFRVESWRKRTYPLIFGQNCGNLGFYWWARDLMGTEGVSYAIYDQPDLLHDIMEHHADFLIEAARPVLEKTSVEYVCLNEDLSMKGGPLISPRAYKTFIFPRLKRVIEFYKSHGVRYVAIDTDGNPEAVVPLFMDAGVDVLWPLERASDQDPVRLRQKFGRSLRLWGGVDKRELAKDKKAIDEHLRSMCPLIEEGGFIPAVDHTVPPDIPLSNFLYYMERKQALLEGRF
jgi:uroporphyrinogen decarboxylase